MPLLNALVCPCLIKRVKSEIVNLQLLKPYSFAGHRKHVQCCSGATSSNPSSHPDLVGFSCSGLKLEMCTACFKQKPKNRRWNKRTVAISSKITEAVCMEDNVPNLSATSTQLNPRCLKKQNILHADSPR